MIWLNPETVTLGTAPLTNVVSVSIDRQAHRTVAQYTDFGRYAAFIDVPEQKVTVRILRRITESEATTIRPGDKLTMSVRASAGQSAAAIRKTVATLVILSVETSLNAKGGGGGGGNGSGGATQRITAEAISIDGAADPVTVTSVTGEV